MTEPTVREAHYQKIFIVFLCLLTCAYYYTFFIDRTQVVFDIEVTQKTRLKIYWAGDDRQFSEKNSASQRLFPSQNHYEISVTGLNNFSSLRFDPIQYRGEAVVKKITIFQKGYRPITVNLAQLQPANQVDEFSFNSDGLHFSSSGSDPYFFYRPIYEKKPFKWLNDLFMMALISVVVVVTAKSCSSLRFEFGYVPIMMAMVLMLVIVMAAISKENAHPDEYVHLAATQYYKASWLPPDIEDEEIEDTYSVYGMSRLNNGEIYYLLAGKAARFFETLNVGNPLSSRLFNVVLFAFIVLYTLCSIPARTVAIPFLISPQVWYVFSYCTSDAFALFLCFIAGCELVRSNSLLNKALRSELVRDRLVGTLAISLMLGLLFLLKKNYYPFIALFYFCLVVQLVKSGELTRGSVTVVRIVVLTILAVGFAGIRVGMDYYVNGLDRQEKILAMQEKTAGERFKPSTELKDKHIYLHKKARNIPLKSLIVKDKWFGKTFRTGFGVYGYFTIIGPEIYYEIVKWFALIVLIYLYGTIIIRGPAVDIVTALVAGLLSIALIGASLHHSWTMDFQAQGRYLFPILSMIGVVLGRSRSLFGSRLFVLSVSQLYVLGLYSFIFIALLQIPRL